MTKPQLHQTPHLSVCLSSICLLEHLETTLPCLSVSELGAGRQAGSQTDQQHHFLGSTAKHGVGCMRSTSWKMVPGMCCFLHANEHSLNSLVYAPEVCHWFQVRLCLNDNMT